MCPTDRALRLSASRDFRESPVICRLLPTVFLHSIPTWWPAFKEYKYCFQQEPTPCVGYIEGIMRTLPVVGITSLLTQGLLPPLFQTRSRRCARPSLRLCLTISDTVFLQVSCQGESRACPAQHSIRGSRWPTLLQGSLSAHSISFYTVSAGLCVCWCTANKGSNAQYIQPR